MLDEHERERSELAHELHEHVAQALAAVLFGLDGLARRDNSEEAASTIASLRGHVADTLEYCTNLAVELRPPLLDQLGLASALDSLGHRTGTAQVRVDPALSGSSLGPALRTDVYRVVEAALTAVSGKRRLVVSLDLAVREVNISVRPLDAETTVAELGTLEARLELLGGTITAGSGGLVVRIPIEPGAGGAIAAFPQPAAWSSPLASGARSHSVQRSPNEETAMTTTEAPTRAPAVVTHDYPPCQLRP
jgi:signal transduction histidine kinase